MERLLWILAIWLIVTPLLILISGVILSETTPPHTIFDQAIKASSLLAHLSSVLMIIIAYQALKAWKQPIIYQEKHTALQKRSDQVSELHRLVTSCQKSTQSTFEVCKKLQALLALETKTNANNLEIYSKKEFLLNLENIIRFLESLTEESIKISSDLLKKQSHLSFKIPKDIINEEDLLCKNIYTYIETSILLLRTIKFVVFKDNEAGENNSSEWTKELLTSKNEGSDIDVLNPKSSNVSFINNKIDNLLVQYEQTLISTK